MEIPPIRSPHRLADLAQQLRLYRAPLCPLDYDDEDELGCANVGRLRFRTAAVLVCIFEDSHGDLRVILTKRSSNLHTSPGEISLPGGKFEEGDEDERATALREAKEEIGLPPELVSVVAVLEPVFTKRLIRVVPVVCVLNDKDAFQPVLNPAEVEELLDVPLEMFLKDNNRRGEEREWHGIRYLLHYFDYAIDDKKYVIWGLTSNVLIRAASVVYQRLPSFTEQDPNYRDSIVEEIRKLLRSQPYKKQVNSLNNEVNRIIQLTYEKN